MKLAQLRNGNVEETSKNTWCMVQFIYQKITNKMKKKTTQCLYYTYYNIIYNILIGVRY